MNFKPFLKLIRNHQLSALTAASALLKPFYSLLFVVAAKDSGLFDLLANKPRDFEQLAQVYCKDAKAREALQAWLHLGVRLGCLQLGAKGYALKGLAGKLARPHNDATLALLQEVAGLHYNLISQTPQKLLKGELWTLDDQDGEIIARSSRILEAFQTQAIDRFFPASRAATLLEIGCGSGIYIRHAATRNPSLVVLGLELQPKVADLARANIAQWGLQDRVTIETGDIRERRPDQRFDIVTLYNNIYYFPVEDRVSLLQHLRQFVRPGGFLLLVTCCQQGTLGTEALNLWGAATATAGRLPGKDELIQQLRQAGYQNVRALRLLPGEQFFAFQGHSEDNA